MQYQNQTPTYTVRHIDILYLNFPHPVPVSSVPVSLVNVLVVPSEAAKVVVMVIADSLGHFCLNLVIQLLN